MGNYVSIIVADTSYTKGLICHKVATRKELLFLLHIGGYCKTAFLVRDRHISSLHLVNSNYYALPMTEK